MAWRAVGVEPTETDLDREAGRAQLRGHGHERLSLGAADVGDAGRRIAQVAVGPHA
jgi:hypothetical protein